MWNTLRLSSTLHKNSQNVNIFLMNAAVDSDRNKTTKPDSYYHIMPLKSKTAIQ